MFINQNVAVDDCAFKLPPSLKSMKNQAKIWKNDHV